VIFSQGLIGSGDVKLITAAVSLIGFRDSIGFLQTIIWAAQQRYPPIFRHGEAA
jgi:Flp pilus assembly protein protease CpaA